MQRDVVRTLFPLCQGWVGVRGAIFMLSRHQTTRRIAFLKGARLSHHCGPTSRSNYRAPPSISRGRFALARVRPTIAFAAWRDPAPILESRTNAALDSGCSARRVNSGVPYVTSTSPNFACVTEPIPRGR